MSVLIRVLLCLHLPWHRILFGACWVSSQVQVAQCSCGRRYAVHHGLKTVLPYDAELERFYREAGHLL